MAREGEVDEDDGVGCAVVGGAGGEDELARVEVVLCDAVVEKGADAVAEVADL